MTGEAERNLDPAAARPRGFAPRALMVATVAADVALILFLLWRATDVLLGGAGVVLATPLTATALVLVRMLYVEGAEGGGTIGDAAGAGGEAA